MEKSEACQMALLEEGSGYSVASAEKGASPDGDEAWVISLKGNGKTVVYYVGSGYVTKAN